jgi:hypothetical protein
VADTADTPKAMYAALGFRPLAVVRKYTRSVAPRPTEPRARRTQPA